MRIKSAKLLIFAFVFSALPNLASAQPISECRIKPSNEQFVSLGFPVNPERLSKIKNPKILVVPYRLKDETAFEFGNKEIEIFSKVSQNIYDISEGKSKVTFTYNTIIELDMTVEERNLIKQPQNNNKTWQERYNDSTWGFMKNFITDQDPNINYSEIDAVVLFSKSTKRSAENAEAMMMTKDLYGPWFAPIQTAEGSIDNVVVLYNHDSNYVLTHEIMHLFGLTDLYGSSNSPTNSLMSDGVIDLLAWEKWVLGWLEDENIKCISETKDINFDSVDNNFRIDFSVQDQLIVIPTATRTALIIDIMKSEKRSFLSFYALDNDARPPITVYRSNSFGSSTEITNTQGIGTRIESPKYTLLITENDGRNLSLNLIPKMLVNSENAKKLIAASEVNRQTAELKVKQEAKAAADLKAKQEADEKAAAELKVKQEAEAKAAADAKAAAELKIKQEADEKAAAELKVKQEAEAKAAADAKAAAELKIKQEADEKAAAELKVKQEAEAKAAADAKAAVVSKKTTITCVKGKLTKKVTEVKPVCPKGYKKK